MKKVLFIVLTTLMTFLSCQKKSFNNIEDYQEWLYSAESGLLQQVEKEGLNFELVHIPQVAQQNRVDTLSDSILDLSFQLKISTTLQEDLLKRGTNSEASYQERVKQLEFQMEQQFYALVSEKVTPSFSHYENFRGIKNEILIHVHFSIPSPLKSDIQVFYKDDVFQTGTHQFTFRQNKILHPPTLNVKTS